MTTTARDWRVGDDWDAAWDRWFERVPYRGGRRKTVLTGPIAHLSPSMRIRRQIELAAHAEREDVRRSELAACAERAAASGPVAWQRQHVVEGEIYEAPADEAGQRKRKVQSPVDAYAARSQLEPRQFTAAQLLREWHAVGVLGVSDRDPTLAIRRSSPMRALPDYQLDALQHYHGAIDAMPDECREVTRAVCCEDVAVSSMTRRSARRTMALMGLLRRGLDAVADYHEHA